MTVIDYATGEVAHLTEAEARRLTERIRTALDRVSTAWADLAEQIAEAYQRRADLALGYASWADYAAAELKPSEGLAADVRRQLVGMLSAQGMSTRAIAPTVGVTQRQVSTDVRSNFSPEPERIDHETGEVLEPKPVAPTHFAAEHPEVERAEAKVVGLDGKTYTRPPAPAQRPNRRAITDAFWEGSYDLAKRVESLKRLTEDDRFARNREAIAAKNLHDLKQTASTLAEVLAAIESINSQEV